MPRVELFDARGMVYRCDTLDPGTLRAWLAEWLPRIAYPQCPTKMQVWPLPTSALPSEWDWAGDTRYITQRFDVPDTADGALAAMQARRDWIEQQHKEERATDG